MGFTRSPMTSDRPLYDEFYDGYRLFVGDLTEHVISTDVSKEFSRFGELIDVWVARNPPGFGFVVFQNKIDCERCKRKLNGRAVFDRPLRIEFARPTPIRDDRRAPASYQAYIARLKERGIEPKFRQRSRSRSPVRRIIREISRSPHNSYIREESQEDLRQKSTQRHRHHRSSHSPRTNSVVHRNNSNNNRNRSESLHHRIRHHRHHHHRVGPSNSTNRRNVVEPDFSDGESRSHKKTVAIVKRKVREEQKPHPMPSDDEDESSEEESSESSTSESSDDTDSDSDSE